MVKFRYINSSPNAVFFFCSPHPIICPPPSLVDVSIPPLEITTTKNTPYNLHRTSQWDHRIQYLLLQTADHLASPMGIWNKTNKEAILGKYHKIEKLNLTLTKDLKLSFVPYHYV